MKTAIKKLVSTTQKSFDLDFLIRLSGQHLILPFYHAVSDEDLIHLKHLYPVISTSRFEKDLDFLQQNYNAVSHNYLIDNKFSTTLRSKRAFFLSFDDGLRQFYDVVAPILLRKGIPATFFVNTGFIDNKDMFYRLKISILIEKVLKTELSPGQFSYIVEYFRKYNLEYKQASDFLLITYNSKELADLIAPVLDIDFKDYLAKHQPYLSTEQIKKLVDQGFSLGAHSVSHPYFPALSLSEQIDETLSSIRFLTDNFNLKERLFSFPYTDFEVSKSFFDAIKNDVDITFGTANLKLDSVKSNLQRIPMEINDSISAESIIKNEYLFFILKMFISKHIIIRK